MNASLHSGQPVLAAGESIYRALAAMLMIHGRGARAEDILSLADQFAQPGFAYLAPQATGIPGIPIVFWFHWKKMNPGYRRRWNWSEISSGRLLQQGFRQNAQSC